MLQNPTLKEGILLIDKPAGKTSFYLVNVLRRILGVRKIGHAGTLDPFATGVMVMLIGKNYTRLSDSFLTQDKEYKATVRLGIETDSYDIDGEVLSTSDLTPSLAEIEQAIQKFQGKIEQTPPMFSAKKIGGQKLCDLARQGKVLERKPVTVTVKTTLLSYNYPHLEILVQCSKGTYIRSIAHDLGLLLGTGAHLENLVRTRSGSFSLGDCLPYAELNLENSLKNLRPITSDKTASMRRNTNNRSANES